MADQKISQLTDYPTPLDADVLPVVDTANTTTKKTTWANIKATLLNNGNVGIGTTAPSARLQVAISAAGANIPTNNALLVSGNDASASRIMSTNGNKALYFSAEDGTGHAELSTYDYGASSGYDFYINANPGGNVIFKTGNVGIGTTAPKGKLDVNGGVSVGSYAGVNAPPANGMIISGNVGIGTTGPAGLLDLTSTTSAFLPPRMTTTQRTALTPVEGSTVYDTSLHKLYVYDGTVWQACW